MLVCQAITMVGNWLTRLDDKDLNFGFFSPPVTRIAASFTMGGSIQAWTCFESRSTPHRSPTKSALY
jgi:hypothetical protein